MKGTLCITVADSIKPRDCLVIEGDDSLLLRYFEKKAHRINFNALNRKLEEGVKDGRIMRRFVGLSEINDAQDYAYDNDTEDENIGDLVAVDYTYERTLDMEQFIMSLPFNEGRVLAVRAMGLNGEEAARLAGFNSIWEYIRNLRRLRRITENAKGEVF